MASTFTTNLLLENPTPADPATNNVWGTTENTVLIMVDSAVAGILSLSVAGAANVTLTSTQGAADQSRNAHFVFTGVLTGNVIVLYPAGKSRVFSVFNNTTGNFTLSAGASNGGGAAAGTTVTIPQAGTADLVSDGTNVTSRISMPLTLAQGGTGSTVGPIIPGLLWGNTLVIDATQPNTVLDVAAGFTTDSTNAASIRLASTFFKSTGGAWAAGAGSAGAATNGMGNALTVQASTWYHVFAIINAGAADVYFDTSVTAANKPASTTAFRRLGSFKTNGSSQIVAFIQDGDYFRWSASVFEFNDANPGNSALTKTLAGVPTGVNVQAFFNAGIQSSLAGNVVYFSDLAAADEAPTGTGVTAPYGQLSNPVSNQFSPNTLLIRTNTSAQIRYRVFGTTTNLAVDVATLGWWDSRGRV